MGGFMSVLVEFSMRPMDKGESFGDEIARLIKIVEESGVEYRLHSMGTVLEGEWQDCFRVIEQCYEELAKTSKRVNVDIRVDARQGRDNRIEEKVRRVEEAIGKDVR
jgi:uncharacterized protein (TIGR00106 family)